MYESDSTEKCQMYRWGKALTLRFFVKLGKMVTEAYSMLKGVRGQE